MKTKHNFVAYYGNLPSIELGAFEDEILRENFIANMSIEEVQKALVKETKSPKEALELAIRYEQEQLNQFKMSAASSALQNDEQINTINY